MESVENSTSPAEGDEWTRISVGDIDEESRLPHIDPTE